MKRPFILILALLSGFSLSFAEVTVPQKGTMNLNLELTDPGGINTVTDTVVLKHIKAAEIEPFIQARLSKYGAVQTDDALNMLIITDMQPKVDDLVRIARKLDVSGLKDFLRLETVVIPVKNISASALVDLIREKLSPGAVIKTDNNSNTLIITDVKSKINQAMPLIQQLDAPVKQVMIEARIVELQDGSDSKTGVDWRAILQSAQVTGGIGAGRTSAPGEAGVKDSSVVFNNSLDSFGASAKATMSIQGLDTLIGILGRDGKARVLSSPRIVGSNNRQANINTGDQIYYTADRRSYHANDYTNSNAQNQYNYNVSNPPNNSYVYGNNNTSGSISMDTNRDINYGSIDTGISMSVVPHVISDDTVTLDIYASIRDLASWAPNGAPIISNRSADSNITIKNGEVFVMGGLKKESVVKSTDRVPILGYIPLISFFFSSDKETKVSNDVIIFIVPTILAEQGKNITDIDRAKLDRVKQDLK